MITAQIIAAEKIEAFTFIFPDERGSVTWNITQAKELVQDGRKPILTPHLEDLRGMLAMNGQARFIDDAYAMKADLDRPPIAVISKVDEEKQQYHVTVIDGWHRIRKAVLSELPSLPMFLLSPAEDRACRIDSAYAVEMNTP